MAQSSSANLTIGIGIDTGKLRADAAIAKAQAAQLGRDLAAAAREGVKSGDTRQVQALGQAYDAAARKVNSYTSALRQHDRAQKEVISNQKEMAGGFGKVSDAVEGIATTVRQVRYGLIAAIIKQVSDIATAPITNLIEKWQELNRISAATGFDTSTIQAFQQILKETGQDVGDATKVLFSLGRAISTARLERRRAGGEEDQRFAQFAPGGTAIFRSGGVTEPPPVTTQTQALLALGIHAQRYTSSLKDQDRLLIDISNQMEKMRAAGQSDYLSEITSVLLGKNARESIETFRELRKLPDARERQRAAGVLITDEDKASAAKFDEATTALQLLREGAATRGAAAALPGITAAIEGLLKVGDEFKKVPGQISGAVTELGTSAQSAATAATKNLSEAGDIISTGIADLAKQAYGAAQKSFPAGQLGTAPIESGAGLQAAGGFISGPGTGTSDSILARLSNGEFVVRADAVRRLGVGFLNRLNRYQAGGGVEIARGGGGGGKTGDDPDGYEAAVRAFEEATAGYDYPFWLDYGSQFDPNPQIRRITRMWVALKYKRKPRGGRAVEPGPAESDEDYFSRTGFHFGPRAGGTPIRTDATETPIRRNPTETPLFAGGLVGSVLPEPIAFAAGGLVGGGASGGRPVHLHLGSQSYALSGASDVVGALVNHAHSQQMRSAGTKPSWFAGRPGGR